MTKYIEVSARTEDEAIASGLAQLGLTRDEVSLEILERSKRGVLGLGHTDAKVRISYEVPDEPEIVPEPAAAPAPEKRAGKPAKRRDAARGDAPAVRGEKAPETPAAKPAAAQNAGSLEERVEQYLRGLLSLMGIEAEMEITRREGGGVNVELSGKGMGAVIGRRGETLDAIQHLVNYSINRGSEKRMHINVDAENYRSKREDSLVHLAEKMAAKTIKYKRSMALEPMNSYERHVIHAALQNYEGVSTASIGVEPNRRVVVSYEKPEGSGSGSGKPQSREWA